MRGGSVIVVIEENELIITENTLDYMTGEEIKTIKDVCRTVAKRRKETVKVRESI